jgi:hypothetical protein
MQIYPSDCRTNPWRRATVRNNRDLGRSCTAISGAPGAPKCFTGRCGKERWIKLSIDDTLQFIATETIFWVVISPTALNLSIEKQQSSSMPVKYILRSVFPTGNGRVFPGALHAKHLWLPR